MIYIVKVLSDSEIKLDEQKFNEIKKSVNKIYGIGNFEKFSNILEKICVDAVENGSMTKDLAILVGPSTKYLTTNQFLDEIDEKLKKQLN